jgi:hypothetical protein
VIDDGRRPTAAASVRATAHGFGHSPALGQEGGVGGEAERDLEVALGVDRL